jgi:hypothetical protein
MQTKSKRLVIIIQLTAVALCIGVVSVLAIEQGGTLVPVEGAANGCYKNNGACYDQGCGQVETVTCLPNDWSSSECDPDNGEYGSPIETAFSYCDDETCICRTL